MNTLNHLHKDHSEVKEKCVSFQRLIHSLGTENGGKWEDFWGHLAYFGKDLEAHLKLEETYLFPRLQPHLPPQGPIQVMLMEHEKLRALLKSMTAMAHEASPPASKIKPLGEEFIILLLNHIMKEDRVLFPMAESLLNFAEEAV